MDQRQQVPYFPPPPGQPGAQQAPPPLPPRQPYSAAGYEYPPRPAGGAWAQPSYPAVPVPVSPQAWGPPTPPVSAPSPYGQQPHSSPRLPERPSSFRGLASTLKSVAQNVHSEARTLASSFAQQNVNKYRPEIPTTQPGHNAGDPYAPPNPTPQYTPQAEASYSQAQYWNPGTTAQAVTLQSQPPPQPPQGYTSSAFVPQTSPSVTDPLVAQNTVSPIPPQVPHYSRPGAPVVVSQVQYVSNEPAATAYNYASTTNILEGQVSTAPSAQPQNSYAAVNTTPYNHFGTAGQTSFEQSIVPPFTQPQNVYPHVAQIPVTQYAMSAPEIQHQNSTTVSHKPVEVPEQVPQSAPLTLNPVQGHNHQAPNIGMENVSTPHNLAQSQHSVPTGVLAPQTLGLNNESLYHQHPYSMQATPDQSSAAAQTVQPQEHDIKTGQMNTNATTSGSGADIIYYNPYYNPEKPPQPPNPPILQQNVSITSPASVTEIQPPSIAPGVTDQVNSIVNGLKTFSLDGSTTAPPGHQVQARDKTWIEDDWCRPPLNISENGEPHEVVWDCPGSVRDNSYETFWFHLPTAPDFLICTRCHDRFLKNTSLATAFGKTRRAKGRCRFNVPRITSKLLPQCLQTQTIEPMKEYMLKRLGIKDCKPEEGIKGREGFKWFIIQRETNDIMVNFVSCEACYEDRIQASIYAGEFIPRLERYPNPQPDGDVWMCDAGFPYIKRSFDIFSRNNAPFSDWVTKATKRYQIPRCEGKTVEASSREWVRPRDKVEGLVICEVCYFDKIAWTAIEADFEYIPVERSANGCSEWMDYALGRRQEPATAWTCDAKVSQILLALEAAVKRQDAGLFSRCARKILPGPACTAEGIANGTWYTLKGGCENYNICLPCVTAFGEAYDTGQFFEKRPVTEATDLVRCNMNTSSPRYIQFALSLFEAQQEGVWSIFADTIRNYIDLPVCPRTKHVPDRKWYGWQDCLICPECYQEVCEKTRGGLKFEVENEVIQEIRMCCLYSPRMREKWAKACESQDAAELVEFSRERHGVYARTVPQIEMLRAMQEMQMMNAMSAGFAGLMYQGAQSIQTVSGSTDGYLHGNSSLGWHETENGVASAQKFQEMNSGFNAANATGPWMQIFQLTMEWEKFE